MKSINPFNLELIEEHEQHSEQQVLELIDQAHAAHEKLRWESYEDRARKMKKAAQILRDNKEKYARVMTREMGKPLQQAIAEVEKCAWVCDFYADNAADFLADEKIETDADDSYVSFEPLGVVLAVMPWNFPFWQVFRFAAPNLMAGNTGLLKHASNVQQSAQLIEDIFNEAGFDPGCFLNLRIRASGVEKVIRNPKVKAATVTGSEGAGQAIAKTCGDEIKPSVLELGGNNGYLVLKDADIKKAASLARKARMINNAQSCIASKRFIVEDAVFDEFAQALKAEFEALKVGDPMEDDTDVGPLASVGAAEELAEQVNRSTAAGAKLLCGGQRDNAFYYPTILTDVKKGMAAFEEELFGPVASLIRAKDAEDAVRINNESRFGLGASIITEDMELARKLIPQIQDGAVFVNELVKSDPRVPFGGTKKSGYGRELSRQGIREFVNAKAVHIKKAMQ